MGIMVNSLLWVVQDFISSTVVLKVIGKTTIATTYTPAIYSH